MKVSINANICDQATTQIASTLRPTFQAIAKDISQDFHGTIEHLWIDFELVESHARQRLPYSFRYQKRVGGSVFKLTGLPTPLYENVGHYSVRPDFQKLLKTPIESVTCYALCLIYTSTSVLIDKQKKLGGFDAQRFRKELLSSCKAHGFEIPPGEPSL